MTQSMAEYQSMRRMELQRNPNSRAYGSPTHGLGTRFNVAHLNLTKAMRKLSGRDLLTSAETKRERNILRLAMAGNTYDKIDLALGLVNGEAERVCGEYGLPEPEKRVRSIK